MTTSVAVMAHPHRAVYVDELLDDLDRPATVVWDQINDRHDTGIRSMEAFDSGCSHHLVVQDDSVVCRDLVAGVEQALLYVPQDVPLCFYLGKVKPFRREVDRVVNRAGEDASWVTMRGIYWGVAVVLPTAHIPEMAAWYRTPAGETVTNYDRRMSTWYALRDASVWYSWPSLVDHVDTESLVAGHGRGRHAHRFVGRDVSALDVDWSGPVVDMPQSDQMDRFRQRHVERARRRTRRAEV